MNMPAPRILVVDDEPDLRALYEITLMRAGYQVFTAEDMEGARALLRSQQFDLLITDMRLPDGLGLELLEQLNAAHRPERALVITAYGSADNAVRALKAGAFDYLTKPVNLDQFRRVVAAALQAGPVGSSMQEEPAPKTGERPRPSVLPQGGASLSAQPAMPGATAASASQESRTAEPWPAALDGMVGSGPAMRQLKSTLVKVAPSMAPVLILGESGSGKELVARGLHACSHRAKGPFVAVNCGAIPEALLEAEFFGARKGSYTGAVADREGFFRLADGGTLFLDEIGDLPLAMQAKLLRVIQERQVRPLGGAQEEPVDVRIVSATHQNLADMVQSGTFRQDLYYRLNVIDVRVPPLRERREDIPALCQALLRRIAGGQGQQQIPVLEPEFLARLQALPLPGNVRELENTLHRCWALSDGHILRADLLDGLPSAHAPTAAGLPAAVVPSSPQGDRAHPAAGPQGTSFRVGAGAGMVREPQPPRADEVPLPCDLAGFVDAHERALLLRALHSTQFNRTAAAALLGLNLRQIRYRMERLGIADDGRSGPHGETA